MRNLLPLLASLLLLFPPAGNAVQEGIRPLYRPVDELRALATTYQWCTLEASMDGPPEPFPSVSLPPGRLRLRGAFPGDFPQELVLEGAPRGEVLVDDRGVFVGRIIRSSGRFHTARTLFAPGLCVSVQVGARPLWGLVCGGRPPVLQWIPLYVSLSPGETLRTVGFAGMPEGLLVGTVTRVDTSLIEPGFYRAEVTPFARMHTTLFLWSVPHESVAVDTGFSSFRLP